MVLPLFLAAAPTPAADITRCEHVMQSSPYYAVRVRSKVGKTGAGTTALLAIRSVNLVDLDLTIPAHGFSASLHWVYEAKSRSITGYDPFRRATTSRLFGASAPAPAVLALELSSVLPDAVQQLLSAKQFSRFLEKFRNLTGWSVKNSGSIREWVHGTVGSEITLGFDRASGRLVHWQVQARNSAADWHLEFLPLSAVPRLRVPQGTTVLDAFRVPPPKRLFRVDATREAYDRAYDAYEKAVKLSTVISVGGEKTRIWRNGSTVCQVSSAGGWCWSSGRLTAWPKSGGVYEGRPKGQDVATILHQLGLNIEPLTRSLVNDDNYTNALVPSEYQAKSVGSVKVGGSVVSLLEVLGPGAKINIEVGSTGLVNKIDSTVYSSDGKPILETTRDFTYYPLGFMPPIPKGERQPLPTPAPAPKSPKG